MKRETMYLANNVDPYAVKTLRVKRDLEENFVYVEDSSDSNSDEFMENLRKSGSKKLVQNLNSFNSSKYEQSQAGQKSLEGALAKLNTVKRRIQSPLVKNRKSKFGCLSDNNHEGRDDDDGCETQRKEDRAKPLSVFNIITRVKSCKHFENRPSKSSITFSAISNPTFEPEASKIHSLKDQKRQSSHSPDLYSRYPKLSECLSSLKSFSPSPTPMQNTPNESTLNIYSQKAKQEKQEDIIKPIKLKLNFGPPIINSSQLSPQNGMRKNNLISLGLGEVCWVTRLCKVSKADKGKKDAQKQSQKDLKKSVDKFSREVCGKYLQWTSIRTPLALSVLSIIRRSALHQFLIDDTLPLTIQTVEGCGTVAVQASGRLMNPFNKLLYSGAISNGKIGGTGKLWNTRLEITENAQNVREVDPICKFLEELNQGLTNLYFKNSIKKLSSRWTKYQGQFRNNVLHGKGTIWYENSATLQGEFFEGQIHGACTFRHGKFSVKGYWENNILKQIEGEP